MEGLLFTAGMVALMVLALAVMARFWPRSSRRTGFHLTGQDGDDESGPPVPEDDDAHWNWRDRGGASPGIDEPPGGPGGSSG